MTALARALAIVLFASSTFTVASAETYLTEAQAVKIAIPTAVSLTEEVKQLTPEQRASLQRATALRFPEAQYKYFLGYDSGHHLVGRATIMNEVGKEEYITFIVGMSATHEVTDVAVLEFRESRGSEVREKRYLRQYHGKKSGDPIQVHRDILNYTGATLSASAVARGVKKALLLTDVFYPGRE